MFKFSVTVGGLVSAVTASPNLKKSLNQITVSSETSATLSAETVTESWYIRQESYGSSCTATASDTETVNTKMGVCKALFSYYVKETCSIITIGDTNSVQRIITTYSDNECSTLTDGGGQNNSPLGCSGSMQTFCSNSMNKGVEGQVLTSSYSTESSCLTGTNSNVDNLIALRTRCTPNSKGGSYTLNCASGKTNYGSVDCSGSVSSTQSLSSLNCQLENGKYISYSCDVKPPTGQPSAEPTGQPNGEPSGEPSMRQTEKPTGQPSGEPTVGDTSDDEFCFHVESKINYKGVEFTYEELRAGKEPECSVPHSPSSKGVVVSTSCGKTVRVTDTHLLATTKGFQLAYSLKAGDILFGDYDKELCTVKSVEKEKTVQQYFGLNCVHSEVLASGIRASTFGDFHTLPSWYMTYVGGLLGTETASSLGEYVAEWYFKK